MRGAFRPRRLRFVVGAMMLGLTALGGCASNVPASGIVSTVSPSSGGAAAAAGVPSPSGGDRGSGSGSGNGSGSGSATVPPTGAAEVLTRQRAAFPAPSRDERIRSFAEERLASMTLDQKIASLFMVHVAGADPAALQAYLTTSAPGGLLLLGDNVPGSTEEAAALTAALPGDDGLGTLVAIDEEGGIVARLGADTFASAETLKNEPVQATTDAFTQRADLLQSTGMTVNFGVIADVTADPSSFIYERVLGTDAASASERVTAAVEAENGKVLSTVKHFPGHGAAPGDSHSSLPTTDLPFEQWQAEDAPPFQAGIDAGAPMVMFGHLVYSAVDPAPASLSAAWHAVLRDDLGFDGVAVTDDLLMLEASGVPEYADRTTNAIAALNAGNDLLLYNTQLDLPAMTAAIVAAVHAGQVSEQTIDEAALRDLSLRRDLWLQQHPVPVAVPAAPAR
ncbi:glycoside hydrolase family 3 protein [Herbiconiux sp. CPCC 205763]|uniref:beta-N-acetylhexosaminidase n=1 Tax=Herbiconiux aconitum TaxID=2970913 RepID=A0ABT2GQR4_9MICO|nr:glycoside hydrolase family 3 N-terminal domain-containing protein [Herbiconiux aconitum]MCS5718518.1 glycoside hydrolase family 3 protein [Herbiconiux aconitum]